VWKHQLWANMGDVRQDAFLGLALLFGYIALTVGMLWNHKRRLLGFLGAVAVSVIVACAVAVAKYNEAISQLTTIGSSGSRCRCSAAFC